ncbi:Protein SCAV-4, partial [Aphelenchoides avenae]
MSVVPRCLRSIHCCTITSLILALISLATTLFLWIGFPIVFNRILKSQLVLQQYNDGQLSQKTYLWAHPPSNTVMNFYMYNVNNVDEILYYGGKPNVTEVGPFAV